MHNPQTFPQIAWNRALALAAVGVWGVLAVCPALGQAENGPSAEAPPTLLTQSRQKLSGRSYQASLTQSLRIGDRRLKATGTFIQGPGLNMRMEVELETGGTTAQLLQVCDSGILYTQQRVNNEVRLSRRDVQYILTEAQKVGLPPNRLEVELGIGGIVGLLASLEMNMNFGEPQEEVVDGQTLRVVEGTWNAAYQAKIQANPQAAKLLPQHLPAAVLVYFDGSDFPRRIRYLQKRGEDQPLRPMVTLDFNDVKWLDESTLDKSLFKYEAPAGVWAKEVTEQYIQMLQRSRAGG